MGRTFHIWPHDPTRATTRTAKLRCGRGPETVSSFFGEAYADLDYAAEVTPTEWGDRWREGDCVCAGCASQHKGPEGDQ
jgi:hypothetical protein